MVKKVKVRLLVGFGGELGGADSPAAGEIVEVDEQLAEGLCSEPAEDPRAEYVLSELKTTKHARAEKRPASRAKREER